MSDEFKVIVKTQKPGMGSCNRIILRAIPLSSLSTFQNNGIPQLQLFEFNDIEKNDNPQLDFNFKENVRLTFATSDPKNYLEISEISLGSIENDSIKIPLGEDIEIIFKIFGETGGKTTINIFSPQSNFIYTEFLTDQKFEIIENPQIKLDIKKEFIKGDQEKSIEKDNFARPEEIPEEYRIVLEHLKKHNLVSEPSMVNLLGGGSSGSRKARRFAANIDTWLNYLPFKIEIIQTPEGKTYRREN